MVNGVKEIFAVLTQAHPLLVNVQFFKIENHLLFQPFAIQLQAQFLSSFEYALTDSCNPLRNESFHLVVQRFNSMNTTGNIR